MITLCNDWEFIADGVSQRVRLPHNVKELPLHYALPEDYEGIYTYRKKLQIPAEYQGKRLFLQLDGAAHIAKVYVNGDFAGEHRCGYTAFRLEITKLVKYGEENILEIELNTRETQSIPPFGFVIDYLTYGGLYRELWLDIREQSYIQDIYVTTPSLKTAQVEISVEGKFDEIEIDIISDGDTLKSLETGTNTTIEVPEAEPWSIDEPKLYTLQCKLIDNGKVVDMQRVNFGFRTAEFRVDGFYLNGEKCFIKGLNRHQSYPYVGYAVPKRLQYEDARILKEELQCNAVRTSHYPQSQHFIDACDSLGLLVFTEIPGWQYIGDEAWKAQALENTREMVLQYRNHPSIILWGVRINESVDDDDFYKKTNEIAHQLDPSRATSGVRYIEKSHLLEDVYAYNDFSHNGTNAGVKKKKDVVKEPNRALLISEHNGHMFPTKSYDPWEKRQEQALRHSRVLLEAMEDGEHVGCFGWCMFDYATHQDFGSGDRICYHGVMDMFRNPKLAAAFYASMGDKSDVLEIGCPMDIGDYSAGQVGNIYAFTNAETVNLYKNDRFVCGFNRHSKTQLEQKKTQLLHKPILIDDTIGQLLESEEGFQGAKAELLRQCMVAAGKYGLANLPISYKAKMLWCMLRYHMSFQDGVELYGKYVGNWGGQATRWRFDAIRDGKVVASQTKCPGSRLHIEARLSHSILREGNTYDMAAVRIRLLDEWGNVASYAQLPISFQVRGAIELVGASVVTAEGGMTGCYVKTIGKTGNGELIISSSGLDDVIIEMEVKA